MDPVKFLEFKNAEDKCRSTASNTVPIACANCGSNDYNFQTIQPANYLAPLYPGMPSFKLTSDNFKDNFPINSHLFPRPFFQPVFHNGSILSNAFYAHNNIGMMFHNPYRHLSEEQSQEKCERNNKSTQVSNCSDYLFNQTHQMPTCAGEIQFNRYQPKDNNAGGDNITNELEKECRTKNSEESDTNCSSQCVCNNPTTPWLYSPFVLPIISYYILWNSQCSESKQSPTNHPCNHSQMRQNRKEDDETKVSDASSKEEKDETDFNETKGKLPKKSKDGVSEDFWTDDKTPKSEWKINNQKNGSSSSFFSISSLDYGEDIFLYTKRKTMSNNCGPEIGAGKSNAATSSNEHKEAEESAVKCETNQSDTHYSESYEKVKAYPSAPLSTDIEEEEEEGEEEENEDENENNENDDEADEADEDNVTYVNNNNEESLITEQVSDSKIQNDFEKETEMMSSEIQLKAANVPSEDLIASVLSKSSQDKLQDHNSEDKKDDSESPIRDRVTPKKMIKNFTMADETKFYKESKTLASMAAGGDLGGEHCVGYRVDISSPPRQRENVQNLNNNEYKMETNEILLKGKELTTDRSEENNDNSTNTKESLEGGEFENKSNTKTKLGRNFKSGIAKLSSNFKAKSIDSNTKNSEVRKNCVPEIPKTRRKHNCMATVRTTENNEGNSKIQKSKYSRERQGKNLDSARENRPPNNVQKQSTKILDSRQKRKDQPVRAPCKSSL